MNIFMLNYCAGENKIYKYQFIYINYLNEKKNLMKEGTLSI